MKYSLFFLIVGTLQAIASVSYSQTTKITLNMQDATVAQVISRIEDDSQFYFTYNTREINPNRQVSVHLKENDINALLEQLFAGENVEYIIIDKHVVLYKNSESIIKGNVLQGISVIGIVTDAAGIPLPGVNVVVKGTTTGVVTNVDGKYNIVVPDKDAVLVFSFVGYTSQEIVVGDNREINIGLKEGTRELDEVVVIGYGVLKKKLVTGATVQVKGNDIQKLSTISPLTALQSQSPGLSITSISGMPDADYKVNIRGLGTIGNASPLVIINGIVGGDLKSISPSDIESIDVLKDAASAAIYGARAANGVILITTKQGRAGKVSITYDGYYGIQTVSKYLGVLDAQQYMNIQNESLTNIGVAPNDYSKILPSEIWQNLQNGWTGTHWLKEFTNNQAPMHNHALNISGGTEQSLYSIGITYSSQEGLFGQPVVPTYDRISFRVNTEQVLWKGKNRDIIKFGENILYTQKQKEAMGFSDVRPYIRANPLLPVYDENGDFHKAIGSLDADRTNPIGDYYYNQSQRKDRNHDLKANAYIEIQPIKNLYFKSNFGFSLSAYAYRSYVPSYNLGDRFFKTEDIVNQNQSSGMGYQWENTLTYQFTLDEAHHFSALLGQSIEKGGLGENIAGQNMNSLFDSFEYAYLNNVKTIVPGKTTVSGSPWERGAISSFFGRVNYDYKETYLVSVVLRADGSSKFARGHRWGYFPSVALGWVISNESFMESTKSWMDFFKIRASWGQNGNQDITPFQYLATYSFAYSDYFFGDDKKKWATGAYPTILPNEDISWETSQQTDIGFDARFFKSRLSVAFDWYNKSTIDWLVQAPILGSQGAVAPYINGGDVTNKGIELSLTWRDQAGDFSYSITGNMAYNKNKITRIANTDGIIEGANVGYADGVPPIYRAQVGYPIGYFYGYQTEGVFQNQAQIDDYKKAKISGAAPGDLIFVDRNENGALDADDRTMIGDPNPDLNLGLVVNLGYKGFDFSVNAYGFMGNQIASSNHLVNHYKENYPTQVLKRWHGEGTSNRYPRLTADSSPNFMYFSNTYIDNGDFLRIQNVTLGYDFKKLFPEIPMNRARIYLSVQNLFTFTKYYGADPEVGSAPQGWARGIDMGTYPTPRSYIVGVNLNF